MPRRFGSPLVIHDLLSYRLGRAANLVSRSAALRYRREFDISVGEWRALAVLAADAPLSLHDLARIAGLATAQMSRIVSDLVQRNLILQQMSLLGGRIVGLSLTTAGEHIYGGLIAAAAERDAILRGCLEPDELVALESALVKLASKARRMIISEPDDSEEES